MDDTLISLRHRLNPFAFPAETNVRFTLLMVAALMLACNLSIFLTFLLDIDQADALSTPIDQPSLDAPVDQFMAQTQTELLKLIGAALQGLGAPLLLVLIVLGTALVIYRTHPSRLRRQKKLSPFPPAKDPKFHHQIKQMAHQAEITPVPTVEVGAGLSAQNGQAFGLPGRYSLRLDGGLRLLMRKAPPLFQAIVLHELAHIANKDIGRTYFAQALWTATLAVTIIPLVLGMGYFFFDSLVLDAVQNGLARLDWQKLLTRSLPTVFLFSLQVVIILGLVATIRASLLRIRENYADWRAALWGGGPGLIKILQGAAAKAKPAGRNLWRLHPTPSERLAVLQNPAQLFQVGWDLPFIVGVLLAFAIGGLFILVIPLAIGTGGGLLVLISNLTALAAAQNSLGLAYLAYGSLFVMFLVTMLVLAAPLFSLGYLIAGTVGLQIQRETAAGLLNPERPGCGGYLRLLVPAGLLAGGLELGFLIAPLAGLSPVGAIIGQTANSLPALLLLVPWFLAAAGLIWLCLIYTRYFARQIYSRHFQVSAPIRQRKLLTFVVSCLVWLIFLPILIARVAILFQFDPATRQFLVTGLVGSLVIAVTFYLILFAAGWLLSRLGRLLRSSRCPHCQQQIRPVNLAPLSCPHCQQPLLPWLFAST